MLTHWKYAMSKYSDFSGRADRPEFWWTYLMNAIVGWVLVLLALGTKSPLFFVLYAVWMLATLIPVLAVGVRRLHDTDRSGAWLLLSFIPIVGAIVLLVFLASVGTPADNRYGPVPVPLRHA